MEFFSLQSLFFFLVPTFSLYIYIHSLNKNGFRTYPILGTLPGYIWHRNRYLDWLTENITSSPTNTALFRRLGLNPGVMTADPSNIEHVLKSNFTNYQKGPRFIATLQDLFGHGLFLSNGDKWRVQRRALVKAFGVRGFIRDFVIGDVTANEIKTWLVPILEDSSKTGKTIDLQVIFQTFLFDTVCKMTFDADLGCLGGNYDQFMSAFNEASGTISGRLRSPLDFVWKIKKILNVGSERRLEEALRVFNNQTDIFVQRKIKAFKEDKDKDRELDLLSLILKDKEEQEDGETLSPEHLREIVTGIILAGQDTTASALTWFFWILSSHPETEEKILNEIKENRARNGKNIGESFNYDELREMQFLHAAIAESMRIYPPVPMDARVCVKDDILPDGTFVRKDWFVSYHAYTMAKMESIWGKNCLEFCPERWLNESGFFQQASPFRYPVFNAGPRTCLGIDMAYGQVKFVAASIIERFVIVVRGKCKSPNHSLSLTLKIEDGLKVTVKKRQDE